jgi:hypothetical protein
MAADEELLKRRYREFLDLTPVAIAIAGLPPSEGMFNFTADQMEIRASTLSIAYKLARQVARETVSQG